MKEILTLKEVSKIYSSHGVIATGFQKITTSFSLGEFVAITGESGSGKSTLLHVLAGLDGYEEGEMLVEGKPTSDYTKDEIETYRKQYVSNIFQSFHLIHHYTVYQNVELVLLMSGYKANEVKEKVHTILKEVGLDAIAKKKASKLSGGQKQRVAIARALAKETPIILADEPTGNLDVEAANEIMKLLHQISKDKLVIVVTHNYEQVEPYATRKIRMHDGKIVEDKKLKEQIERKDAPTLGRCDALPWIEKIRLGIRNTFRLPAKFMLLLFVFLFLCSSVCGSYVSITSAKNGGSNNGERYNAFFKDSSQERLLLTKKDKKAFTKEDYKQLASLNNVQSIIYNDLLQDIQFYMYDKDSKDSTFFVNVALQPVKTSYTLTRGRMPRNENEAIFLYDQENDYVTQFDSSLLTSVKINEVGTDAFMGKIKIVGIGHTKVENYQDEGILYVPQARFNHMFNQVMKGYSETNVNFANKQILLADDGEYAVRTSPYVEKGRVYIPTELATLKEGNALNQPCTITSKTMYEKNKIDLRVGAVYTSENMEYYLGSRKYEDVAGGIYISEQDYRQLYTFDDYQASVFVKDVKEKNQTIKQLQDLGYDAFDIYKTTFVDNETQTKINNMLYTALFILSLLLIFFVSYFILKLILKSRTVYYATIRMIGATKKNCASILRNELFLVFHIAFGIVFILTLCLQQQVFGSEDIQMLASYMQAKHWLILYFVLLGMCILLKQRYVKHMFNQAAMDAYFEEV